MRPNRANDAVSPLVCLCPYATAMPANNNLSEGSCPLLCICSTQGPAQRTVGEGSLRFPVAMATHGGGRPCDPSPSCRTHKQQCQLDTPENTYRPARKRRTRAQAPACCDKRKAALSDAACPRPALDPYYILSNLCASRPQQATCILHVVNTTPLLGDDGPTAAASCAATGP